MTTATQVRQGAVFGGRPLPDGDEPLVLDAAVGPLTALRARPRGDARGVVLVVPGFTGSKEDHVELLPLLAAHGWDAWSYSQRGQGDSVAPAGITSYRLEDFTGDAVEVTALVSAEAGEHLPVHLVGHSFGGLVARSTAIAAPHAYASLTLLCSGPHGWPGRKDAERALLTAGDGTDLWRLENPDRAALPDAELDVTERFFKARSARTSGDNLLAVIDHLADPRDRTEDLAATRLPVLVAHGVDDDAWPQVWQQTMARRLGARYEVIPASGHLPNLENPVATAALLDSFWTSVTASS